MRFFVFKFPFKFIYFFGMQNIQIHTWHVWNLFICCLFLCCAFIFLYRPTWFVVAIRPTASGVLLHPYQLVLFYDYLLDFWLVYNMNMQNIITIIKIISDYFIDSYKKKINNQIFIWIMLSVIKGKIIN